MDITTLRLANQHLTGDKFNTPEEVVEHLGAVQAQDYHAVKWSLGLRINNTTDEKIEKAYNEGKILRTHIMRPTWHFVLPENVMWIENLTSARVKAFMGHYNRKLELTEELFKKTNNLIVKALTGNNFLTRQEIKKLLAKEGIICDTQRLGHIVSWAELDGLIVSGPRCGKQFTYALLSERAPNQKKLDREKALSTLAEMYFKSHGPAQLRDFAWWSGLTKKDAQIALESVKNKLNSETVNDKTYWFSKDLKTSKLNITSAFLLSIFDEYTIAYNDRSDLSEDPKNIEKMIMMGNALTAVMVLNGKVVGTWKRIIKKNSVQVILNPFRKLGKTEYDLFEKEAGKLGKFINLESQILA